MHASRRRGAASPLDAPLRILVVTAHPDDEVLLAPYLHDRCVRGGADCTILVMTGSDVRSAEMARSAALLNLRLLQWHLPDVFDPEVQWDLAALRPLLRDTILAIGADAVITFDPAHGTTGHPAHRLIGALVQEVTEAWMLETLATFAGDGFVFGVHQRELASAFVARQSWEVLVRIAETHASQFTEAQLANLRTIPDAQRVVWLRTSAAPRP